MARIQVPEHIGVHANGYYNHPVMGKQKYVVFTAKSIVFPDKKASIDLK